MIKKQWLLIATAASLLAGCATTYLGSAKSDDPLGQLAKKRDALAQRGVLAAAARAESRDLQTGISKVELETRGILTRAIEAKTSSLQKSFQDEVGSEFSTHFASATKTVASRILTGSFLQEHFYQQADKNGNYQVYGLMVLDPEKFKAALEAEMAAEKAMHDRFLASKAYAELKKEAEEYDQYKRDLGKIQ